MPIEASLLKDQSVPLRVCPACGEVPFVPDLRGCIQRSVFAMMWASLRGKKDWRGYCALICEACEEIVGYEYPIIKNEDES